MENKINKNFVTVFNNWRKDNWSGKDNDLAKFLGVSPQHVSNIKTGKRPCGEKTRIKICQKIGVDYRTLIEADILPEKKQPHRPPPEENSSNVMPFPAKIENDRLRTCIDYICKIFDSGNQKAISLIETNLAGIMAMCNEQPEREVWNEQYREIWKRRATH